MIQFYAPDIATSKTLPESDSRHCSKVLRMVAGDMVEVVDGKGNRYQCEIINSDPRRTSVEIVSCETLNKFWKGEIILAVAPTKHLDRMEWMVEKLTEIGIDRIIPVLCDRSERREIKTERLEKIAVSAMKQSLQAYLPKIDPMTKFSDIVTSFRDYRRYICHCDETSTRRELYEIGRDGDKTIIMIGPEGDFSPKEIERALSSGWEPVTLGENRLRTETAALVAVNTIHLTEKIHTNKC